MRETGRNGFQYQMRKRLEREFPGCIVLKNDPSWIGGIPDLLMVWGPHWAALETKAEPKSKRQPNQPFYVDKMDRMSYASFVSQDNVEEVIDEIHRSFGSRR
jgi:hypothetical protein